METLHHAGLETVKLLLIGYNGDSCLLQHRYNAILDQRLNANEGQEEELACLLSQASPGMAEPQWANLASLSTSMCFVVGENDSKYADLACKMRRALHQDSDPSEKDLRIIKNAGHAVHVERPEILLNLLHDFAQEIC